MIKNLIVDFLFPTQCIVCGINGKSICHDCFDKIPRVPKDRINILSIYEYRNEYINKLLWRLKYKHSGDIADIFAPVVAQEIKKWIEYSEGEQREIVFIPAPLNKYDPRIHNHAELLATAISKYFPKSQVIADLLIKNSQTKQAHTKNKHERLKNIENTISISKRFERFGLENIFNNKLIIIVDDVTTTGSTICNIRYVVANFLGMPEENILATTVAH